jgi:NAD(P)-dependent dehydrogenase (short-subunit alcohol dehydrogenase family)
MKTIVITGSTRGIGFGLADAFLASGCSVLVSGRSQQAVEQAVTKLAVKHPRERIHGVACDTRDPNQVQNLWDQAIQKFTQVNIWVNNAGIASPVSPAWEVRREDISAVIDTNLKGAFYGTIGAIRGMLAQGFGAVYNLEGLGSEKSRVIPGMSLYGLTKAGLRYFNDSLFKELEGKSVIAGALQPGMVVTDLIGAQNSGDPAEFERVKWITNIIGNRVEDVTPWLVEKMLANTRNGARFRYMSSFKTTLRFLSAPFVKRDLFSDQG